MTTDYRPIPCDAHSVLELLAMRRRPVRVTYLEGPQMAKIKGLVVDLVTREGVEYLVLETEGKDRQLRLDRIERIDEGRDRVYLRQDSGSGD